MSDSSMAIHIESLPLGLLETNCHIIWTDALDALVIDPSGEPEVILDFLEEHHLQVKGILLTHAHFDHIGALPEVARRWPVPIVLDPLDLPMYQSPKNCMPPYIGPIQDLPAKTVPALPEPVPGLAYEVFKTPGHTTGSLSFYFAQAKVVFSGDALFRRSIGRTDLPGGDTATLFRSIRDMLFSLPDDTQVLSGHGPETSIGEEKAANPFVGRNANR